MIESYTDTHLKIVQAQYEPVNHRDVFSPRSKVFTVQRANGIIA